MTKSIYEWFCQNRIYWYSNKIEFATKKNAIDMEIFEEKINTALSKCKERMIESYDIPRGKIALSCANKNHCMATVECIALLPKIIMYCNQL